jgi:hypothetical protein
MANDIEAQTAKVREMSDEEFAAYKAERIELRESVMRELEEARKAEEEAAKNNSNSDEGGTEAASQGNKAKGTTTPPAQIAPGQAMAAAMNFEHKPSDDMLSKYADMGKAMAASMTPERSK